MKRVTLLLVLVLMSMVVLAGCSKSPQEKRQDYISSAQKYLSQGKYAEAAIQYQNALQITPDDVKTLISLGEAQLKLSRPQEAYAAFMKASQADPKNVKSREYIASMLLLAKRYDLAEQQASTILQNDSKNILAKEVLAQSLFMNGKREQGIKVMEGLLGAQKPTEDMYINTIQMYMSVGRVDDAISLVNKGTAMYPKSTKLRFVASDIYALKNDPATARKWAEEAYRVSGGNVSAGVALAMFYARHNMDALYQAQIAVLKRNYPQNSEPYLLESSILHQKHDLDGALRTAQKARELKDSTQIRTLIAQILLEKKDSAQAKSLLIETVKNDPGDVLSKIMLARIYIEEKDATKAIEMLDDPLKRAPQSPDVASTAAQAYIIKGDVKKARELVENSLKENAQNIQLHRMMAKIHFLQGEFKGAAAEAELLVKHSVNTPDILYIGALSTLRTSGPQAALPYIEALKTLSPDDWITLHAQLRYYLDQNDKKNAYLIAERAVNLYPHNDEALSLYSYTAPGVIGWQGAIAKIKGICTTKGTASCHIILSALLEGSGKKDEALSEIKTAIGLDPKKDAFYHALAQYYARNNMVKNALEEYQSILNKNPDDITAATMLALLYQNSGKLDDAQKVYKYILDKNPKNGLAANNLAWVLTERGKKSDLDEALKFAQTAKDMYPDDPRVADTLGYVYLKKGLPDNALGQFQLASEKLGDEPTILYHMALALMDLKRDNEAVSYLKKSLLSAKQFPEKQQAQEQLTRLQSGKTK
jgi:tetratricopeptide (TPR) repeat protein